MFLIIIYLFIIIMSGLLLGLFIKYLKEKPFGAQFVTDHLSRDLAVTIFCTVCVASLIIIAREVHGPFNEATVDMALILQQFTNSAIVTNILSIQIGQICNVFFAAR